MRPAIEAYVRFNELEPGQPLEALFANLSRPCCARPDIDYNRDGLPVESEKVKPDKRIIEAAIEDRIDVLERGVTFWTHEPIRVHWAFDKIPDSNDSFQRTRTVEQIWDRLVHIAHNLCGVRFVRVQSPSEANLTGSSRWLGPGVLGLAQVAQRGMAPDARLWHRLNPSFDLSVLLLLSTWIHEIWHSLGCPHLRGGVNFMNPSHMPQLRVPGPKDREWSQRHYPQKTNFTPSTDLAFVGWEPGGGDQPDPTPDPEPPPPPSPEPPDGREATIAITENGQTRIYRGVRVN